MLESLVASVLNRTLGAYIENFDPNQLNIGIWSGDVKLKNLKLKKESLDKLNLPIELKCGHLGDLTLQIPWSNLKSQPVKVLIENVYLLSSGRIPESIDFEEDIQRELRTKRQRLDALEVIQAQKAQLETGDEAKNQSFVESLTTKIVDNLQVTIKNIHFRYEDNFAFSNSPYAVGMTLKELSAVSTDGQWIPSFIENVASISRKLMTLDSLSIYWDTENKESIYSEDIDLTLKLLQEIVNKNSHYENGVEFLLEPVSGEGRLTVNKLGAQENQPHYDIDLIFEQFKVDLNALQYRDILETISRINWYRKTYEFKKFRPRVSVNEDPQKWLKYAFECVYDEIHQRNYKKSWTYMKKRRDQRKEYIILWCKYIQSENSLTIHDKVRISNLEEECNYDDIKFYRSLARRELKKNNANIPETSAKQNGGWFSSWWGSGNRTDNEESPHNDLEITEEQKNEFYEAIEFDESKALGESLDVPRERVNIAVSCQLKTGSFAIRQDNNSANLAECISTGFHVDFFQRVDSYYVGFRLNEFKVEDGSNSSLYKHIVSVKPLNKQMDNSLEESEEKDIDPLFQFSFEHNPLDQSADSELLAKLNSMTIYHSPKFINLVGKFFKPPKSHLDSLGSLLNAAEAQLSNFSEMTRLGIQTAFEEHKSMNCKMDLQAPLIILPVDANSWDSPVGILDAGHISILSDLVDKENIERIRKEKKDNYTDKDWNNIGEYMYDKFKLVLQDAQILIGPNIRSTIEQLHFSGEKSSLILDHFNMNFLIETSIIPALRQFPKIKISGNVPSLNASLNDYQYKTIMKILDTFDFDMSDDFSIESTVETTSTQFADLAIDVVNNYDTFDDSDESMSKSSEPQVSNKEDSNQRQIQIDFDMDMLVLSLKRCSNPKTFESDKMIDLVGKNFKLEFFKTISDMYVDLSLADMSIDDFIENSNIEEFQRLLCTNPFTKSHNELFMMNYSRSLRLVSYNGDLIECYDQNINMNISDFQLVVSRKSILTLLNYSLNTFTDPLAPEIPSDKLRHISEERDLAPQHIDLNINMKSLNLILNDENEKLATLTLDKAQVGLFMLPDSMKLSTSLGGFNLVDNSREINHNLITIQGNELMNLYYETYDHQTNKLPYSSNLKFETESLVVWFMEDSFNKLYSFICQFQQMKYIYDDARDAALNQANNVESPGKMKFDILIRAPIFIFPKVVDPTKNLFDNITVNLGEVYANNCFEDKNGEIFNLMNAGLQNTEITSSFVNQDGSIQNLNIIEEMNINFKIDLYDGNQISRPLVIIDGGVTGKEIKLTEWQAFSLMQIIKSIPRIFNIDEVTLNDLEQIENDANDANMMIRNNKSENSSITGQEEVNDSESLKQINNNSISTSEGIKLQLKFNIPLLSLSLFNNTRNVIDISENSLSKFSLNDVAIELLMNNDGTFSSDMHIKSFVVDDLRKSDNKFTSIIPEVDYSLYQFMASISSQNVEDKKKIKIDLSVDSPQIILAMDYLFALKSFSDVATYEPETVVDQHLQHLNSISEIVEENDIQSIVNSDFSSTEFDIKIFNPSIILLANSERQDSEAIVFRIGEVSLLHTDIIDFQVDGVGMFLCKMNAQDTSKMRLLDDFNLSLNIDSSGCNENTFITTINAEIQPLLLRLSLRDIKLALEIFNRASLLYSEALKSAEDNEQRPNTKFTLRDEVTRRLSTYAPSIISSFSTAHNVKTIKGAQIIAKGERMAILAHGLRMVLIGDVHELPILDFSVDPFEFCARDWSTELTADVTFKSLINIFNYSTSSWEPLLEKWPFNVHAEKTHDGKLSVDFISREKAEFTVTSKSIATLSHFASLVGDEADLKPRGEDAPYRIINYTGYDLNIWIDNGSKSLDNRHQLTSLKNKETIPWFFEDWKKVRESLKLDTSRNYIGVEFLDSDYEPLRNLSLTLEGEEIFMLSIMNDKGYHNRLSCEITLAEDNVKEVILKSTVDVHNLTPTPIHIGVSNYKEGFAVDREIIVQPSQKLALPIDYVFEGNMVVRPELVDEVFNWSVAKHQGQPHDIKLNWRTLKDYDDIFLECKSTDSSSNPKFYYYKTYAVFNKDEPLAKVYPHMTIKVTPPMVIENLLPFDIQYRLFQKGEQETKGILERGDNVALHLINIDKNTIMKIKALDSKYDESQPAIIHSVNRLANKDFEIIMKCEEDGQRLNLGLKYVKDTLKGTKISVFSPYLVVNRTGKELRVTDQFNTLVSKPHNANDDSKPDMFSFSMVNEKIGIFKGNLEKNRVIMKVGDSEGSNPVSIDKIGQTFEVKMGLRRSSRENNIGVHISEGSGIYSLTKVIELAPRYIVKNSYKSTIIISQVGGSESIKLLPGEVAPVYEMPKFDAKQLVMGFSTDNGHLSAPFHITDIGEVYIRVKRIDAESHTLLRVVISKEDASIYINILDAKNLWPYSIRNFSDYELFFYQANPYIDNQGNVLSTEKFSPVYYRIPPKSAMPYAWDFPAAEVKELVLRYGNAERYIQIAEIGSLMPMKLKGSAALTESIDLNVIADGPVQALVISNYDAKTSMYQMKKTSSSASLSSSKDDFETTIKDDNYFFKYIFKFEGLGISLINAKNEELCYITINGVELRFNESDIYQNLSIKLKWLQVDNQLYSNVYPIIIYPTVVPKSSGEMEKHPAFSAAISRMKDTTHGVQYIKFATMLLQELSIEVDEDFLWALIDFSKIPGATWNSNTQDILWDKPMEIPEPPTVRTTDDLYFEALHLQPLQFNLSFARTERVRSEDNKTQQNALNVATDVLTMAIGNINEAPVRLSALFLENIRTPMSYLIHNIQEHYTQAFLYQFYKVLGSADVLGNPVGLFNNISSGVMDIFYEPYQGYIMTDRPQELGIGLAKGSLSFLKKSVFGFSDSFSRFSSSMAKGLTAASMDRNFQERRRYRQRNIPKHPMSGFSTGAYSFFDGISSGITGLATAPIEGANKDGAVGFVKGIGKGLWGLPTKTATGVFDLANNVSESIRNTTTTFDNGSLERVRYPRYIPHNGSVIPYSEREAHGLFWLKTCDGGLYSNDEFLGHTTLSDSELQCVISMSRILIVQISSLTAKWQVPYELVMNITLEQSGIRIKLKNRSATDKFISVTDKEDKKYLYQKIAIGVAEYNKKCAVEL
ncbi:membrane morphogenesis protein [Martiniozyma asiatica (nom. inval.)]|nr:membrane morphogenesis protein [Martiniozyma asiatica]